MAQVRRGFQRSSGLSQVLCFTKFEDKLSSFRNYNPAFINSSRNLRASNFKDHAGTVKHKRAMSFDRKEQGADIFEYSPLATSMAGMDKAQSQTITRTFEIAYVIAKQKLAFSKMSVICELEERHEVSLGNGYKNDHACGTFVKYIAMDLHESLQSALNGAQVFLASNVMVARTKELSSKRFIRCNISTRKGTMVLST